MNKIAPLIFFLTLGLHSVCYAGKGTINAATIKVKVFKFAVSTSKSMHVPYDHF